MDNQDRQPEQTLNQIPKQVLDQHARDHVFLAIQIFTPIIAMIIAIIIGCTVSTQ